MATNDFVVKNGLVVTDAADILSVSDASSSSDTAASIYTAGGVAVAKKAYVGTDLAVGGATTLTGDIAVNGGDVTTNQTTFNLVNATATAVNFAGAATTISIGAATGTTTINNANTVVTGDLAVNGGDVTTNQTTFNLINTTAATVNFAGAGTAVNIGAATGTLTVGNPTLTMTQGVAVNMNGANPVIASTNTGTASLFNSDITAINFGHAAAISMGSTTLNTTVRGNLVIDGNTTLGDASADLVTVNANTANVPNSLTFTIDDAIANNVSYPIAIRHTTSGTAANNIGVGLQFVTETAAGVNRAGVNLDAVATSAANGAENFSFVVDTMTTGGTAAQALLVNNNTVTVGASSTATTVNTQLSSNLTVTTGASGVTSNGNTVTVQGGAGGTTSGAGGAISVFGGEAATSGTGGTATFRAGNATGTNIIGADTLIDAGQGTGTGRSGQIVFRTGPGGASGASRNALTTVLTLTSGGLEIPGNLTVGGNFTVDGLVTTVNSTTMSVDDKNIELGSVVAKGSLQAILATGTAVVTLTTGDTKSLIPGMALTVNTGSGAFGASSIISTVDSLTQFTASVNHSVSGIVTFTAGGATDFTANGGGITIKGATDKTFNWVQSTGNWTANTNISAPSLISTVATGTAPFTVASTTNVTNLNADLLDGLDVHTGTNNEANKIVRTDGNGYIQAGWINTVSGDNGTAAIDRVYASNDGYIRYYTPTNFRTVLNVPTRTGDDASGTWAISISGNAATATTAGAVVNTVAGTASVELVRGNMGDNDQARILVGATATNAGFLEIATADDGTEPIHVRQYTGVFTSLERTATLLGSDGNTSFPGTVTANGVTLTGNLGTVTSVATSGTVSGLTLTGGTITTSGTITLGGTLAVTASNFASQTANTFLAAPNGAAGVPTFRTIVAADVPTLNQNTTGSATFLTSSNYINQAGNQGSWNADFQATPAGSARYGGDVGASTTNNPGGSWWIQQNFRHTNTSNFWGTQVAWGWEDNANKLATRNVTGGIYGAWVYYLNSSNVGSYAVTSLIAGGGITISGTTGAVTVSHADTSSQASVDNSNGTVIQDVTLDTYGHVIGLASVDLDLRYLTAEADTLASVTGRGFITRGSSGTFADGAQGTPGLEIYGAGTTNPAYMTFHRPGQYAIKLGLDGTDLKVGGWSMGAVAHRVWHEGNITPLTAEADTLATVTGRGASTATVVTLTGGGRFSAPDDGFYSFTNVDSDSTHYTSRTNRILTSNGANWVADGKDAVIAITRSSSGTTRGQSIGLTLHNENNTINAYSPAITFTAVSNSGSYNSMYAAIMGKKTGANAGVDSNWNKGELHFYAVGDAYVGDTPNMVMTGTAIGMNTASPAARLHVVASAVSGIGSVPAGTSAIIDSSTNNYLLFRNTADNGTYSGIAMQDNNMGGYVVFGNAGGGGDQLYVAGYGGGNLQAGSADSISPAARTTYLSWSANGVGITSGPLTLNSNRLYFASVNDNNHAFNYPGGTFNGQANGTQFRWYQYLNLFSTSGGISVMHMNDSGNVGVGTTTPTFKLQVNGSFAATTKSFLIDHPTKPGMQLRYGSLEGPELGVYVRGKLVDVSVIELPDYWTGLVHADSITVNLTAASAGQQLYVERIENNCVYIVNETGKPVNCFYTVYGERKDVDKLEVEID